LKDAKGTTTLFDRNYSYDPANQISQIAEISQTRIFSYDNLDRLTQMTNGVSNENYVFDSVGNRTASHRSATHSYQPYNQMTATSNATMSYDANGNMISRSQGAWTYVWDHENRMKSAASGATSVAYAYDALGRRVRRTQGTQITKFTYDGLDVVMDDVNGTLTKYQNGPGIDNKLKLVTGTTSRYFVSDHLGSTNALTSSTGAILEQTSYDSFGNASNTSFSSRYQFTGREYDSLTGFHYYRNRWYDANIGRFISEDPIGFAGGDNWYTYVGNEPLAFTDPLGLGPFRLPPNPGPNGSNLPPGWKPAPGHKNPGGERWISPGGDEGLDFHPGKNGGKGFDGEDHWHKLKPKRGGGFEKDKTGGRKGGHFRPGDEVDLKECSPGRLPKTAFEFQLDEQYHREMEKFWGKILGGSLIGGAVLLGGGPALGGFAGEAAGGAAAGSGGFPWWLPAFGF